MRGVTTKTCGVCGKEFQGNPRARWCPSCRYVTFRCDKCGQEATQHRSRYERSRDKHFCSRECAAGYGWKVAGKMREDKVVVVCPNCGKTTLRRRSKAKRVYCNRTCYFEYRQKHPENFPSSFSDPTIHTKAMRTRKRRGSNWSKGRRGPACPAWNGGKTEHYKTAGFQEQKHRACKRDGYRCRRCDMTEQACIETYGAPLQVHHIVPWRLSRDNRLDNLQTLCHVCHGFLDEQFKYIL